MLLDHAARSSIQQHQLLQWQSHFSLKEIYYYDIIVLRASACCCVLLVHFISCSQHFMNHITCTVTFMVEMRETYRKYHAYAYTR